MELTREHKKEIEKMVYELVPFQKREMECLSFKRKQEYQRNEFRKMLIKQAKEKSEY